MDKNTPLIGKKAVIIHRCSGEGQVKDSLPQQRKATKGFIEKYKIRVEKECEAPAISASIKKHKKLIYDLRDKKVRGELDFEIILFADWSRFTRTGRRDGHRILAELADEDIMVVTVKDGLLVGRDGENRTDQSLRDSEAYAESLALNTARGVQDSIENGEIPHSFRAPYGTDRCYLAEDGTPQFILRDSVPGKKVMLNPVTREVIKELNHSPEEPAVVKQSCQTITLVKGPPEETKVVNQIFRRRYIDGWGSHKIAKELNEAKVPGPRGKQWVTHTVEHIYHNKTYLGTGYANQSTTGVYARRDRNFPTELPERRVPGKRKDGRGQRESIPVIVRPVDDHVPVEYPRLVDMLEPRLHEVACGELERWRKRPRSEPAKTKYVQSGYLLAGVLRTKQLDLPMKGTSSINGRKKQYRYYYTYRSCFAPGIDERALARMPADPIEMEVKSVLAESLSDASAISARVRSYIDEQIKSAAAHDDPLPSLLAEKTRLECEYRNIHEIYGKHGQELLRGRVAELERLLDGVDARIRFASGTVPLQACDAEAVIKSVTAKCASAVDMLSSDFAGAAKRVVESFISKATFDLDTKEVEIEVGLPSWAISAQKEAKTEVRELVHSAPGSDKSTHFIPLGKLTCLVQKIEGVRNLCVNCTRLRAAA